MMPVMSVMSVSKREMPRTAERRCAPGGWCTTSGVQDPPVMSSKTMHARLHMSQGVLYLAPRITSGDLHAPPSNQEVVCSPATPWRGVGGAVLHQDSSPPGASQERWPCGVCECPLRSGPSVYHGRALSLKLPRGLPELMPAGKTDSNARNCYVHGRRMAVRLEAQTTTQQRPGSAAPHPSPPK